MNQSIEKEDILEMAQNLNSDYEGKHGNVQVSGVYVNGEVGFPLRIFKEESEKNGGEPKNYNEAYQKACNMLKVENCNSYEEHGFVWFSPNSK